MPEQSPSDVELMVSFAKGDLSAFDQLIVRHQQSVINTIYRLIGDAATAEDLAQEVFLNIFRAAPKYKPTAAFRTWLFRITRNVCYNELRRRVRRPVVLEGADPEVSPLNVPDEKAAQPFETMTAEERGRLVRAAIGKLPPAQRLAVILRRYEGMTYSEIAEAMDKSMPAVKSLLSRAKSSLAESLGQYFKK